MMKRWWSFKGWIFSDGLIRRDLNDVGLSMQWLRRSMIQINDRYTDPTVLGVLGWKQNRFLISVLSQKLPAASLDFSCDEKNFPVSFLCHLDGVVYVSSLLMFLSSSSTSCMLHHSITSLFCSCCKPLVMLGI